MKKYGILVTVGFGVLAATVALAAVPANAAPAVGTRSSSETATNYSDLNVVEFLVFGQGPITIDRPELLTELNISSVPQATPAVINEVLVGLQDVDPAFHMNVTIPAQAGDPYEAERALKNFSTDVAALAAKEKEAHASQPILILSRAAGTGSVWAFTNYVVSTQVAVAAAAAVSVLAVALALAVLLYEHPEDGSPLVMQNYASSLGSL
jgi:SdpC family antimicrobial peptide